MSYDTQSFLTVPDDAPSVSAADATRFCIEKARTTAGFALWQSTQDLATIERRVSVRIASATVTLDGKAIGRVYTKLDDGDWCDDGVYVLSDSASPHRWHPAD